jgi:hypothetical protein
VNAGDVLTLTPPPEASDRIRYLTISGSVDDERRSVPGGEIAFDETRGAETITRVARVISGAVNGAGTFSFLARFASAEAADLIQSGVRIRYYAPYRISVSVTLQNDSDASIRLPIPADAGSRTAYVAVTAADERGNESPISTPAHFAVFKPKPSGIPTRPYPCLIGPSAEEGYATPPDRLGRATICLRWAVGAVSPATGLRYEVARALDNGIVAAHMRNWHLGKPDADVQAPMARGGVDGAISGIEFDDARGLYRVTFEPNATVDEPLAFRQGRLSRNGRWFEVTFVAAAAGGDLELLLRSASADGPTAGAARIEAPPDYASVRNDNAALLQLAERNPEAFGIVTGMPVPQTEFTDEVAGIGSNRFFYRVRAVDAAENRSGWSPISVPFHQADTTPPHAPGPLQVVAGDRVITLIWPVPSDAGINNYRIFRSEGSNLPSSLVGLTPFREISLEDLVPAPLFVIARGVSLPKPVVLALPGGASEAEVTALVAAQISVRRLTSDQHELFDSDSSRTTYRLERMANGDWRAAVHGLTDLLDVEPGTAVRVRVGSADAPSPANRVAWTDTGVIGGVAYEYCLVAVKQVTTAPDGPGLEANTIHLQGVPSAHIQTIALDYSDAPAPQITGIAWVDASGQPAGSAAGSLLAKVTVSSSPHTASVLLQRQAADSDIRANALIAGERGWKDWPIGAEQADLLDSAATPTTDWTYTATVRMRDGRTSTSDPVTHGGLS